jgi:large subunit ribosomal protein L23
MRALILKPLINEKSMALAKGDFYTFLIDLDASKDQVAKIVREKFGVSVLSVKTITRQPKSKNQRTRKGTFMTAKTKKAIVQVGKGQRIALFEEATKEPEEEVEVRTAEGEKLTEVKEKKSLLKGTKVKIEKTNEKLAGQKAKVEREETVNQAQSQKTSSKESK